MLKDYPKAKTGPTIGCAPDRCGACPVACFQRPRTGGLGKVKVLTVNSIREVPTEFKGIITFNFEPPTIRTSEQTCPICKKSSSTCFHSET